MNNQDTFFSQMGEAAILFDPSPSLTTATYEIQRKVWITSELLGQVDEISELVPGMNNLLVMYDPFVSSPADIELMIGDAWDKAGTEANNLLTVNEHRVPVIYGGESGEDLYEVASTLSLTVDQVIELHTQAEYTVFAIGSQPGLPYMGGINKKLVLPRRKVPRTQVKAGAVIIGGAQASILSRTSACGWHLLGETQIDCFDLEKTPPTTFLPGDKVRFTVQEVCL